MRALRLPRLGRRDTEANEARPRGEERAARRRTVAPRSGYDPSALSPLPGPPAAPERGGRESGLDRG